MNEVARKLLTPGAVGIMPTDTVYGLVARAKDKSAVSRLYEIKKRLNKPGTVIAANIEQLVGLGLKKRYLSAVKEYWPGSLSVIIPCGDELEYIHLSTYGIAVRIPGDERLIKTLRVTGPLITTSANLAGEPTAKNIDQAKAYFPIGIDFYEDGGEIADKLPSTIVRIIDDAIEVIRQGAVKIN
jgi:L-threonylcarbamoyladenylate synthase